MRSNPWQITAIIAIILVVLLIIPLVMMARERQTLMDNEKGAKDALSQANTEVGSLKRDVETLKTLIGMPNADMAKLQEECDTTLQKVLPGEGGITLHGGVVALLNDLAKEQKARGDIAEQNRQLNTDLLNEQTKKETAIKVISDKLADAERALAAEQRRFQVTKADFDKKFEEAHRKQEDTLFKAERDVNELQRQVVQLSNDNTDISDHNRTLTEQLEGIRNPNVEYPAGKIISVDQQAGSAIINLGSADGLLVRTMFSVYHASVTGLSFRTAPVGRDAVYCDVCKREIARDVAKASVEVMQILGPHRAEVRILSDVLTDPIMAGDVVYSPIWKPGQKLRFALTAGMHLPGASVESGNEAVKRLIEMNGGVVDCWIEESVADGEHHLKGSITDMTNFIVVNERVARELNPEVARVQQALVENAKLRTIKVISLEDLLNRMSWKNMTPVHIYDKPTYTSETRVIPQHQGTIRQSTGVVSPRFSPDNAAARINPQDANPVRSSPGVVSPLFNDNAPPPPSSSGKTSDLFRPRSPQ
jgi:hypothetical protein